MQNAYKIYEHLMIFIFYSLWSEIRRVLESAFAFPSSDVNSVRIIQKPKRIYEIDSPVSEFKYNIKIRS